MRDLAVGELRIDLGALASIAHRCNPDICKNGLHCCSCYHVVVDEKELNTIVGYLPLVAAYTPNVEAEDGYLNLFQETAEGGYLLDVDDSERCLLAYASPDGRLLCALHSAALDNRAAPADIKPRSCSLWPLTLSKGTPRRLGVDFRAFDFPCNRRKPRGSQLDPGIAEIIAALFGRRLIETVDRALLKAI